MSSNSETHADILAQPEKQSPQQQPDQQDPAEDVAAALQVSEPSSAAPSSPHGDDDDGAKKTVPTIEEPEAGSSSEQASGQPPPPLSIPSTISSQQQQQLSPAAAVPPRSPASSRYTIDDDDEDAYYEDGFEGGQLTILQGPGHQAAPVPKEAPPYDIRAELDFVKARLETIAKDLNDSRINEERVALQELQKSTEIYIAAQDTLAEKQQQLSSAMGNEGVRTVLQSQVDQLTQDTKSKERQWSATKEVYHREFGQLMDSPRKLSSVRAKTEIDIQQLQEQIAHLQRQLDTVAARRRQMVLDAEEHRRRYAEADLDDE